MSHTRFENTSLTASKHGVIMYVNRNVGTTPKQNEHGESGQIEQNGRWYHGNSLENAYISRRHVTANDFDNTNCKQNFKRKATNDWVIVHLPTKAQKK